MRIIDILGVPHAYDLTASTDEPCVLVFIHGWLLSRNYWQPLIERLAPLYQCLAYDLRGFGSSQLCCHDQQNGHQAQTNSLQKDWQTAGGNLDISHYRPAAYAEDLAVLLKTLNLSNAWLIGHSLGGTIALWSALQVRDRVKGVICLNSGGGIYIKEEFERFRTAGQQLLKFRPRWLPYLPLMDLLFARTAVGRPIETHWGRQRLVDFVNAHLEAALGTLLDSTTESEVHLLPQIVSKIQQPVYFLAGTQDSIMEPKYVRHLASFHSLFQLDGKNVMELPNCGHLSMVEQPDLVAEYICKLIKRHELHGKSSVEV